MAFGELDFPFSLYTAFPHHHVPGSTTRTLADCNLNTACLLVVEEDDSAPDLMSYMQDEGDEVSVLDLFFCYCTVCTFLGATIIMLLYDFVDGNSS